MIEGTVCSGMGKASLAFIRNNRGPEIERALGIHPYPGTLNLRVPDLSSAVLTLGEPEYLSEHESRIGPLRWWRVNLHLPNQSDPRPGLVVRGLKSSAPYLELVSSERLRQYLKDGDRIRVSRA